MDVPFDIVNCKENKAKTKNLFDLVVAGNAILFVGSGCSLRLKYPSWSELLYALSTSIQDGDPAKDVVKTKIANQELLLAAEIIKNKIGIEPYDEYYQEAFKQRDPGHDRLHRNLVDLKFKGFATTNYDPALTSALKAKQAPSIDCNAIISDTTMNMVHKFIKSWSYNHWNNRLILYQHGYFRMPSTRVLSYGEYVEKYSGLGISDLKYYKELVDGTLDIDTFEKRNCLKSIARRTRHYSTMYTLMATQRLVYMGYGLRDPYLNKVTDDMSKDFHVEFDDFHYAVMRVTPEDLALWTLDMYNKEVEKWQWKGIELVFYLENSTNTGLDSFIQSFPPDALVPEQGVQRDAVNPQVDATGKGLAEKSTAAPENATFAAELETKARNKNKKIRDGEN